MRKEYNLIVVDPPWDQRKTGKRKCRPNQGKFLDYSTMTKEEIKEVPISKWAAENCFIWLWATNSKDKKTREPILKIAFELLEHWGFTYYTTITWNKENGVCPFGSYQITTEHVLFGYKGKAVFPKESLGKMKTCFTEKATMHSVKPSSFYENINKWFSGNKLDVFGRQIRDGFDGWGLEYGLLPQNVKRNYKRTNKCYQKLLTGQTI